jgi:tetratricopeptide (TPR) repeat protein
MKKWFCSVFLLVAGLAWAHPELESQIESLTQQIASNPDSPANVNRYIRRGELHRLHKEWDDAIADYDKAQSLKPALSPEIKICRGQLEYDRGDYSKALVHLDEYLETNQRNDQAFALRASVWKELGRPAEAAQDLESAFTLNPNVDYCLNRTDFLESDGQDKQALTAVRAGLKSLGDLQVLEEKALDLEVKQGLWPDALKRVNRLLARAARKERLLEKLGDIYKAQDKLEPAKTAWTKALAALDRLPESQAGTDAMAELRDRLKTKLEN